MAEEEKEEKKSSKLLPIIIGAVGGIVLLLAGLALGFFLFSSPAMIPQLRLMKVLKKTRKVKILKKMIILHQIKWLWTHQKIKFFNYIL